MKAIFCIDPGPVVSGAVLLEPDGTLSGVWPEIDNDLLRVYVGSMQYDAVVIEMIASYGMPVGREIFETCVWIGRFIESAGGHNYHLVYRKDVKLHLCGTPRAKDANIRQAILDRYPPTGGGATPQVGTKMKPARLYGVSKHAWAALAVGLTYLDTNQERE